MLHRLIEFPALKEFAETLARKMFGAGSSRTGFRRARCKNKFRPILELLEDRWVPSTFVVNELSDTHAANLVSGLDASGHVSLRSAIEAADHLGGNQMIEFDPTVLAAPQTIKLSLGLLDLRDTSGAMTIQGPDAGVTISGNGASRVFELEAGTHADLTGLTIVDGRITGEGGGILNDGTLTLSDCTVSGNAADFPVGNHAPGLGSGGGIFNAGTLTLSDSTISGNTAEWGGGISNYGPATLTNSTVSGNTATQTFNGFYGEYFGGQGGGIWNRSTATLTNTTVSGNVASFEGGGIGNGGQQLKVTDSTISGNSTGFAGGGIFNGSDGLTVTDSTVSGNAGSEGGGIFNAATATILDSILTGNFGFVGGGGIWDCQYSEVILNNCTVSGNSGGDGGGILDHGTAVLKNSTLSGNLAWGNGGGIYTAIADYFTYSDPILTNCTISGNTARADGGGIFDDGEVVNLSDSTVSGNTAVKAGGVYSSLDSSLTLKNTIVAGNTSQSGDGDLVGAVLPPSVHNLIGDGSGITGGIRNDINGNQVGTSAAPLDPLLSLLGNNGGPTQTMALLPGSPAINAGSNAAIPAGVTTDQRGEPRIINGTVDIGAFEVLPPDQAPAITSASSATFVVATARNVTITTTGFPAATLTIAGTLPPGVTFVNHGNGTATLGGTPKAGSASATPYTFTIQASNGVGAMVSQTFTLTINQPPAIASAGNATFVVDQAGTFTVTTTGYPLAALSETGKLPAGVTWVDNGNGTATLSGTPLPGSASATPYTFTIHAANGVGAAATQTFKLTIHQAPAITSAASATFVVGHAGSFTVTTTGFPVATLGKIGTLPAGLTWINNGNGTATLKGTPTAGTARAAPYTFTIQANNGVGATVTQAFQLTIDQAPAITSPKSATFTVGEAGSFTVTTRGFPFAALTESGTLPAGLTWTDNGNGTATLSGTPLEGSASSMPYSFMIHASNGVGSIATQTLKLIIS